MKAHHQQETRNYHVHLVSDSTGDTISSVARACLAQFDHIHITEHFWNLVRTDRQMDFVIEHIQKYPGIVMFTLVDKKLKERLQTQCRELKIPAIPLLESIINELSHFFGMESQARPGKQYLLNDQYFSRIDAIDFFLAHDDGQLGPDLYKADIIIVGVSRTSKTPTSMYLANRGFRVANFPYVPGIELPKDLFDLRDVFIVGLTKDADSLVQIRLNRLKIFNQAGTTNYVDPLAVKEEVNEARRFFRKNRWPVIDVSKRSIEETAAEIINLFQKSDSHSKSMLNNTVEIEL